MTFLCCPDSFKGSLTALQAAHAMRRGILAACPDAAILLCPMADGGEGTLEAMMPTKTLDVAACDALGRPLTAPIGLLEGGAAIVEMALTCGLTLVPPPLRHPLVLHTRGLGLQLAAAAAQAERVYVGIGGSATNDGGVGMAQALDWRFLDAQGRDLPPAPAHLMKLHAIEGPAPLAAKVFAACDVTSPLCGPEGAAAVFGPQKGATPDEVEQLDEALAHLADVVKTCLGIDAKDRPGAGAAGGMGFGLAAFCGAELLRGVAFVSAARNLPGLCARADVIITGEGRTDGQSARGKVPAGVIAAANGKPVWVISGSLGTGWEDVAVLGATVCLPAAPPDMPLPEAMKKAAVLLQQATRVAVENGVAVAGGGPF